MLQAIWDRRLSQRYLCNAERCLFDMFGGAVIQRGSRVNSCLTLSLSAATE